MTSKTTSNGIVDHNAGLIVGTRIDGVFTRKLVTAMVVNFKHDGKPCSGVLHVSNFPSNERAMRDKMFEVAKVGMPAPGLTVIDVAPPQGDQRFTKVRLSARTAKENATAGQRFGAPANKTPRTGGNAPARTDGTTNEVTSDKAPTPAPTAVAVSAPVATIARQPIDPVTRARQLSLEVRQPARSVGLADLKRAFAIKRLEGDSEASALLGSIESHLSQIDALAVEAATISSGLSEDILPKATTLYAVRAQKRELDAKTTALKQESARYAGLCGKIKRAGANVPTELKTQADEMKSAIEAKRASLKEAYALNKKQDDDADLDLIFSLSAPDIKAAMDQALEIASNLAGAVAKRDQLVIELGGIIDAYESRLATLG